MRWWIPVGVVAIVAASIGLFLERPVFGEAPDAADRARFARSAAFDANEGRFENRRPERLERMRESSSTLDMLREWLRDRPDGRPARALPTSTPDLDAFLAPGADIRLIWLGHSSFLLNMAGVVVLVDPVFSDAASPVSFVARRFQPPALSLTELPPIDVVLISHDHYDHLDHETVRHFVDTETTFVTPLGVGSHLVRWGIDATRISEHDWWESRRIGELELTALPAQHFSGRSGFDTDRTLWASWALISPQGRLYFSGDSGYDTHFAEIGRRLGPFDLALLENGQYDAAWAAVHLMPEETLQAFEDLRARRLMPIHWGMFELAFHTWYDPIVRIDALARARGVDLVTPLLGQVTRIDGPADVADTPAWWETSR